MNLYKKILDYFYTRACLKLISEDTNIRTIFSLKDESGRLFVYPQYQWLTGFMIIIMKIEKSEPNHKEIIQTKISMMDELSISMGIVDVVDSEIRFLEADENYSYYMMKFKPAFEFNLFDFVTLALLGVILKIVHMVLEYIGFFKLVIFIWEMLKR